MGQLTIRQKINNALLNKEERLLRKHEIVSDQGNLTEVGRRVLLDVMFGDKDIRTEVVNRVKVVDGEDK